MSKIKDIPNSWLLGDWDDCGDGYLYKTIMAEDGYLYIVAIITSEPGMELEMVPLYVQDLPFQ